MLSVVSYCQENMNFGPENLLYHSEMRSHTRARSPEMTKIRAVELKVSVHEKLVSSLFGAMLRFFFSVKFDILLKRRGKVFLKRHSMFS